MNTNYGWAAKPSVIGRPEVKPPYRVSRVATRVAGVSRNRVLERLNSAQPMCPGRTIEIIGAQCCRLFERTKRRERDAGRTARPVGAPLAREFYDRTPLKTGKLPNDGRTVV